MQTIIIGKRSNLSEHLLSAIDGSISVSAGNAVQTLSSFDWSRSQSVNLVLNQFQPATRLNDLSSPIEYIDNSILSTANILNTIQVHSTKINKIIYTSSSSVYGNNPSCKETDVPVPNSLHATLKLSNEMFLSQFCEYHSINLTIARVFNMYAGNDKFSIISKIISAVEQSHRINLINKGSAIRDFIHIDDVTNAYQQILSTKQTDPVINIASGQGTSVAMILDHLQQQNIAVSTHNIEQDEIQTSIANNDRLLALMGQYNFRSVRDYVLNKLRT